MATTQPIDTPLAELFRAFAQPTAREPGTDVAEHWGGAF